MKKDKRMKTCHLKEEIDGRIDKGMAKVSLKKKVRRAMTTSSVVTVLVLTVVSSAFIYMIVNAITHTFIQYSASQMALVISDQWDEEDTVDIKSVGALVDSLSRSGYMNVDVQEKIKIKSNDEMTFIENITHNLIHYRVVVTKEGHEQEIYNTEDNDKYRIDDKNLRALAEKFTAQASANIYNFHNMSQALDASKNNMIKKFVMDDMAMDADRMNDYRLGYVEASINPSISIAFVVLILVFVFIIFMINGIISGTLRFIFSGAITKPVSGIADQLKAIAEGDIESSLHQEIVVKRPVKEVQLMMDSTNAIMDKTKDFMATLEAQKDELEAQKEELVAQNSTLEDRSSALTSLNDAYLSRTLNFQNLLDNVGQGFMTFGADLRVNPEYSMACESAVDSGMSIEGEKITQVLAIDPNDIDFVEDLFKKIFESNPDQRDLYTTLLPDEMTIDGRYYKISYKHVSGIKGQAQMLVITTDITEQRVLESQVEQERNILQMIVKVMMNRDEFVGLHNELKEFSALDFPNIDPGSDEKILREIHTLKGSFSQYYMANIAGYLDDLETSISRQETLIHTLDGQEILQAFNKDLSIIKGFVDESFFVSDDFYTVKEQKIIEIEQKLKDLLPDYEFTKVLPLIQSIRHKSVQTLLGNYTGYSSKLAERLGKRIYDFDISGDEIYVDNGAYAKVFKTLVHVFRNAVDHGIEDEDQRLLKDKDPIGRVTCHVEDLETFFKVTISDDGGGIDLDALKEAAKAKGVYNGEHGHGLYDLLFKDGLTTQDTVSPISGRGVGLSAVKYAVEELGGRIEVVSDLHKKTSFIITLPVISDTSLLAFSPDKLMDNVARITQEYINSLGVSLVENKRFKSNKISLKRVNALISIKGAIEGVMFFSTNEVLGEALMKGFVLETVAEEEKTDYIEDVLGEITNTVIGNVLGALEEQGIYLTIGVPALISNKDAYMKYSETEILVTDFIDGAYELSLNLLSVDSSSDRTLLTGR